MMKHLNIMTWTRRNFRPLLEDSIVHKQRKAQHSHSLIFYNQVCTRQKNLVTKKGCRIRNPSTHHTAQFMRSLLSVSETTRLSKFHVIINEDGGYISEVKHTPPPGNTLAHIELKGVRYRVPLRQAHHKEP